MAPVLLNLSARAMMRVQLRQDQQESRTGLRREGEVSAAAAAVRSRRWRSGWQSSEVSVAVPAGVFAPTPGVAEAAGKQAPAITITAPGPVMLARLRLEGFGPIADFASFDTVALRHGLGDVSRLLHVEGWITEAKLIAESDKPAPL